MTSLEEVEHLKKYLRQKDLPNGITFVVELRYYLKEMRNTKDTV